ncbi:hypothetical protein GWI33_021035 [Rhynchophorus ferrugineus]|uniref:C2H2-type domain-containing protein n=1 Tax=Rhynchophorus ferrugineus TaxID=354439 RepID=A0A834HPS0_RHYFE|nr:hypothetical protein GWI33_021035 [Rhynchophorus ferrugineus]
MNYEVFGFRDEFTDSDEEYKDEANLSSAEDCERHSNSIITGKKRSDKCLSVNIFQCSFCGYQTPFRYILKRHYQGCQMKSGPISRVWECSKCKKVFPHHSHLRRHKLKVHKSQIFSCRNCLLETTDEKNYKSHFIKDKCPKKKMYQCEKCPYKASSRARVIDHEKTHNPNRQGVSKKNFTCTECNRVLATLKLYKRHLMSHSSIKKNYCCEYCDYITEDLDSLDEHKMIHPNVREMLLVQCSRCDLNFFNLKELKEHLERDACTKRKRTARVTSSTKLKKEKASEVSEESTLAFTCHLCPYATKRLQLLTRHCLTIHHIDIYKKQKLSALDQEKGYVCTRCTFVTKYFSNLTRHIKLIHCLGNKGLANLKPRPAPNDNITEKNVSEYKCDVCDIVIVDQYQLAYHKFDKHRDKSELLKWKLKCSMCKYKSASKKLCFNHGKSHVKNASHSKVTFYQFYNGENRGTFFIDYIKNKVAIKTKTAKRDDLLDIIQGENIEEVHIDNDEDEEILQFRGKAQTLSFLEDICVEDEQGTSNLQNILEWTASDDIDLDNVENTVNNNEDEVLIIEVVNDDMGENNTAGTEPEDVTETVYICEKCNATINNQYDLQAHAELHSLEEEDPNLELTFYSNPKESDEKSSGCPELIFNCGLCQFCSDSQLLLDKHHLKVHYAKNENNETFPTDTNLTIKEELESEQSEVDCASDMLSADNNGLPRGKQTFKCTLCEETLIRKSLSFHTNQHAAELNDHELEVLYEEYKQNHFMYMYEVRAHSLAGEKLFLLGLPSYKCNTCGITINIKKNIKEHASVHTKEENNPNLKVSFSEFRSDKLIGTIITTGLPSTVRQLENRNTTPCHLEYDPTKPIYSCDECNFKTNFENELTKHKKLHWTHEKDKAYKEKNWISCNMCSFTCFNLEAFKDHIVNHKF